MATNKKSPKLRRPAWTMSWKGLVVAASLAANLGFLVIGFAMMTTNVFDGMFMKEGVKRYCAVANDGKFSETPKQAQALRDYTCVRGDAASYFKDGFNAYLDAKDIPREK